MVDARAPIPAEPNRVTLHREIEADREGSSPPSSRLALWRVDPQAASQSALRLNESRSCSRAESPRKLPLPHSGSEHNWRGK